MATNHLPLHAYPSTFLRSRNFAGKFKTAQTMVFDCASVLQMNDDPPCRTPLQHTPEQESATHAATFLT